MSDKLVRMLSTFFSVGNFPVGPGSMASAVGVLLYMAVEKVFVLYALLLIIVCVVGFKVSGRMEDLLKAKDPSCIVIDEVAGVLIAFFALPLTWPVIITAFFLFRAFDMFKLYPVNKFDDMGGGYGIMMDDIVAGIYTNLTMQLALRWAGIV